MATRLNLQVDLANMSDSGLAALLRQSANNPQGSLDNIIGLLGALRSGSAGIGPASVLVAAPREIAFTSAAVVTDGSADYPESITYPGHEFATGDPVVFTKNNGATIGGLTSGTTYFVIRSNANVIKLATTAANAAAGTAINLTSTDSQSVYTLTARDVQATATTTWTALPANNETITIAGTAFTAKTAWTGANNTFAVGAQITESMANTTATRTDAKTLELALSGLPTAGDTFVLNGVTFTAVASGRNPANNEFNIGATATATADNIVKAIGYNRDEKITVMAAVNTLGTIAITCSTANSYALTAISLKNAVNSSQTAEVTNQYTASRSGLVVTYTMRLSGPVGNRSNSSTAANQTTTNFTGGVASKVAYTI